MDFDHRVIAAPAALLLGALIVGEWLLARRLGHKHRAEDVYGSVWCALLEQATSGFAYVGLLAAYAVVHANFGWLSLPPSIPVFLLGIVLVDLVFYVFHRFSHVTGLGWAVHAVHHQPRDLHFAAAVRNSIFGGFLQFPFLVPLALLGLPPEAFLVGKAVNPLYQIWVHTRVIGRIPWLDAVLNTPSNHRVHHGLQPEYRDRNFGGIFIVWDRLFGTYQPELAEPVYGVDPPFHGVDPLRANIVPLLQLRSAARERGVFEALFGPPGGGAASSVPELPAPSPWVVLWVTGQTILGIGVLAWLLARPFDAISVILIAWTVTGGTAIAGWLGGRPWAPWVDGARLAVGAGVLLLV